MQDYQDIPTIKVPIFSLIKRHWDLRYLYNRTRVQIDYWFHPEWPWLARGAVSILKELLRPDDIGFEFGSGRSTLWFVKRSRYLISIEDDFAWYLKVKEGIKKMHVNNICYEFHDRANIPWKRREVSSYVRSILKVADQSLDYVIVDGYARDWCCLYSLSKIKTGGLLIVDNIHWFLPPPRMLTPNSRSLAQGPANEEWAQFAEMTSSWRQIWTSNGITDTLILIKTT
jgi:predicted O-methyltransferase YrrM